MSIFKDILSAVFGHDRMMQPLPPAQSAPTTPAQPAAPDTSAQPAAPAASSAVDVEAVLTEMNDELEDGRLHWRESIVDLLKLLKLDSSLQTRRDLAVELGYTGSMTDTATLNVWLHQQVMTKLAQSGGKFELPQ